MFNKTWRYGICALAGAVMVGAAAQESLESLRDQKISEIEIQGIKDKKQLENARAFLALSRVKNEKITQPSYINYLIENGVEEIQRSQQPFGYYHSNVRVDKKQLNDQKIKVIYTVDLGAPALIRTIDIKTEGEAKEDAEFRQLMTKHPFKTGKALNHQQYETYKNEYTALGTRKGYFDGKFDTKRIAVDTDQNSADIAIHYDSGQRYHFGKTQFSNAEQSENPKILPLDESLLQRFVTIREGEVYEARKITQLQQDLQSSGYFRQVLVGGKPDPEQKIVPIDAQLTMNKNKHYALGVGYSTDSGIRGKVDFDWRWVNRYGHNFSSSLYASRKNSEFNNMYRIPAAHPSTDYYYLNFGGRIKDTGYTSRRGFIGGGYNWRVNHWDWRAGITTAYEKFTIGNDKDEVVLTYPSVSVTYNSNDNRFNPDAGYQFQFEVLGGVENVLSDISFAQTNARAVYIQPFNAKNRVIGRIDLGANWADDYQRLPPSFRYFAGGDRSIRGYGYEYIGPRDSSNTNIGGKYLATTSLEYEYYFKDDWAAAAFVDAGDAFKDDFKAKVGAGLGVHWKSPVGPIRLDLGHGFDKDYGDNVRIHLTIGTQLDL